jgi:hypothetical protein
MFDIDRPTQHTHPTVRSCEAAEARLTPLISVVAPLARTRPDAIVSTDLLILARQALRAIAPVAMHLEAPAPLPLHPPVTHAGLAARLALAAQQVTTFRRRHFLPEDRLQAIAWHIEDRTLALAAGAAPTKSST